MLETLFSESAKLTGKQLNFLKVVERMPEIKSFHGDRVLPEDISLSESAKKWKFNKLNCIESPI